MSEGELEHDRGRFSNYLPRAKESKTVNYRRLNHTEFEEEQLSSQFRLQTEA